MPQHFSIRAYTTSFRRHYHQFHQLVLPLVGSIHMMVGDYQGSASIGDCVIIRAGQSHAFKADEAARFIVVDSDELPKNLLCSPHEKIRVDDGVIAFCQFLEKQLTLKTDENITHCAFQLFVKLLAQQHNHLRLDKRIHSVIEYIHRHLSEPMIIPQLAQIACLSTTQFKVVFKQQMQLTCAQYIRQCRMQKAKSLLTYTDKPIVVVAQEVGYSDNSSFSRQFKSYYGISPRSL